MAFICLSLNLEIKSPPSRRIHIQPPMVFTTCVPQHEKSTVVQGIGSRKNQQLTHMGHEIWQ